MTSEDVTRFENAAKLFSESVKGLADILKKFDEEVLPVLSRDAGRMSHAGDRMLQASQDHENAAENMRAAVRQIEAAADAMRHSR